MTKKRKAADNPKAHGRKAEAATSERRVLECVDLLIKGATTRQILQHAARTWTTNGEPLKDRQVHNYIKKARDRIQEQAERDLAYNIALAMERYSQLYMRSFQVQDYRTAASVQQRLDKLLGLEAPQRTQHSGAEGGPIEFVIRYPDNE